MDENEFESVMNRRLIIIVTRVFYLAYRMIVKTIQNLIKPRSQRILDWLYLCEKASFQVWAKKRDMIAYRSIATRTYRTCDTGAIVEITAYDVDGRVLRTMILHSASSTKTACSVLITYSEFYFVWNLILEKPHKIIWSKLINKCHHVWHDS